MSECMTFPDTVEEFMDSYKIVDTEQVYTNGTEMVPIYRMRQWFEHESELNFDEWCTDCKEYDHEKHCCPRFNRVIQNALEEMNENIKSLAADRNTNPAHADDGK